MAPKPNKKAAPKAKPKAKGKHPGGRPVKYKTAEEIQVVIDAYFTECDEKEEPYTITGLALATDMTRESLVNYGEKEEFFSTIKKAKLKCHNYAEKRLFSGGQAAGVIFNLKNNYGWKDKIEQEITGPDGKPLGIQVEFVEAKHD
ncbi:MAG: terminase small subunit [Bacillota bacterium]|nr:terminase small subunit [Bacillota bacterium]